MKRIVAIVVGASLLVLPGCGKKTDETARAAGITPATALAMISVNLSPSIEQKRNLLSISRRFPGAKVKGEFDDARDDLLATILEESGLDYQKDVKPWLGKEAAAVVLPPGDGDAPLILAMVQTDDAKAAEAAIAKATKDGDFEGVYAVVEDYVVISDQDDAADNQRALDQIAAQAKKGDEGSLAESAEFNKVVDELAGDRLVLGWIDTADSLAVAEDLAGDVGELSFLKEFGEGAIAFDLHVESKAVVFQGVVETSAEGDGSEVVLTKSLPATTLAALTFFDIGGVAGKALKDLGGFGGGGDFTAGIEDATGIDVQEDILSWMKGEAVVVAGAVRDGQDFPDFALVIEPTDQALAAAGLERIRAQLTANQLPLEERPIGDATAYVVPEPFFPGVQPAMALYPDRFVLANSPAYLGDLAKASTPGLGSSDTYADLAGDADKSLGQFILLIDPIRQAIEDALMGDGADREEYDAEVRPNLEPLSAFGVKTTRDGDFNRFEFKLTLD